ncbi:MAG: arylsulfatase [Planctomycetota bacterium]|jgi:arylsulfatase
MNRRMFLKNLAVGVAALSLKGCHLPSQKAPVPVRSLKGSRPNIVLIMTDDQGYGQLGCQGHPWLNTPNIDALCKQSTAFLDFHVSPTCSPTRAALMTGNVPFKNGVTHTGGARARLALSAVTLPQLLKEQGYTTGIFGKWHLGCDREEYLPGSRGFDEVFIHGYGGIGQPEDVPGNKYMDPIIRHNDKFVQTKGFCTDVFFTQSLGWIKRNKDKPFLAYIATNAPHGPFVAPPGNRKRFIEMGMSRGQPGFYGMIENIDENVGRLMAYLKEWDLERDTLVVFISDNGFILAGTGVGKIGNKDGEPIFAYNAGLKGGKKTVHEGGTRVPAFFRWKGVLKEGVECKALAAHIDILPTLIEFAGGDLPENLDGKSLLTLLENPDADWSDRNLFFHVGRWADRIGPDKSKYDKKAGFAVRDSHYLLVNNEELYDILNDPGETRNLYAQKPEVVQAMQTSYDQWWDEVRPFMINENARMPKMYVYRALYYQQLKKAGIPNWKPPEL